MVRMPGPLGISEILSISTLKRSSAILVFGYRPEIWWEFSLSRERNTVVVTFEIPWVVCFRRHQRAALFSSARGWQSWLGANSCACAVWPQSPHSNLSVQSTWCVPALTGGCRKLQHRANPRCICHQSLRPLLTIADQIVLHTNDPASNRLSPARTDNRMWRHDVHTDAAALIRIGSSELLHLGLCTLLITSRWNVNNS